MQSCNLKSRADHPRSSCTRVLSITVAHAHEVRELAWLDELPHADTLCAALCLKGLSCSEATRAVRQTLRIVRFHSCVEEPGGRRAGLEGVCAYRFLIDNYEEASWQHVYFVHGDAHTAKHAEQSRALRNHLRRDEWPCWPETREQLHETHCGCAFLDERKGAGTPFGPRDHWYPPMTWWLGAMLMPRDGARRATVDAWVARADCSRRRARCTRSGVGAWPMHNGTLSAPACFMFALDRDSALQRSRRFLEAQYRLNRRGLRVLPPGVHGAARDAALAPPGFALDPPQMAHLNERLPFFAFGRDFVERPVPECVFTGNYRSMNCTQPETLVDPAVIQQTQTRITISRKKRISSLQATAPLRVPWACRPFDSACGTVG